MKPNSSARCMLVFAVLTLIFLNLVSAQERSWADEPVKIGYLISLSGAFTGPGHDLRDGFTLYMEEIGYKAGGHEIKAIIEDEGTNAVNKALDAARRLIEKDRIDVLAGVVSTGSAYALAAVVEKHKLPFVISNAGADDLTQRGTNPYIVRPAFVNSAGSHPLGEWAYENGYRKAILIGSDYGAGYEHVGGIAQTFTAKGGKVIQEIWPALGTTDYAPYLAQISRDADVVMAFFAGADALRFVQQYADYGLNNKIPLIGKGFVVDDKILPKQGASAEGIITESHWCYLLDNPRNVKFKEGYQKRFGQRPSLYSEQGYVTAQLIAEALNKAGGKVQGEEFVKVMRSLTLDAPRGKVKFDEYGAPIQNSYIRKVEKVDGDWQSVPIKTYESVSQFWTWDPKKYMEMTPLSKLKGKWLR